MFISHTWIEYIHLIKIRRAYANNLKCIIIDESIPLKAYNYG